MKASVLCKSRPRAPCAPIFRLIRQRGEIDPAEMYRAFNMGAGMILAVAPDDAAAVVETVPGAVVAGEVVARGDGGQVILEGVGKA